MSNIITRKLTQEEQLSLMGYVDYSIRTKLRKIRFKKHGFIKKALALQSSAWDVKNHNIYDDLRVFIGRVSC